MGFRLNADVCSDSDGMPYNDTVTLQVRMEGDGDDGSGGSEKQPTRKEIRSEYIKLSATHQDLQVR